MFKRWFKPKWQHADPEVRRLAIVSLKPDNAEHRAVLEQMVLQDESQEVRLAAARRVADLPLATKAYKCAQETDEQAAFGKMILEFLVQDAALLNAGFEEMVEVITTPEIFKPFISQQYPEIFVSYLLSRVPDDQAFFAQLAQSFPSSRVRLSAAERLTDPELLRVVQESAKGRDKAVFRTVKNSLTAMKETFSAQAAEREQSERILKALAQLAGAEPDVLLPHKLKQLIEQWQSLSIEKPEGEFSALCDQVREKSQQVVREQDRQAEAVQSRAQALEQFAAVCTALEEAFDLLATEDCVREIDLSALAEVRRVQAEHWAVAAQQMEPSAEQLSRYKKLNHDMDIYAETIGRVQEHYEDIVSTFEQIAEIKPTEKKALSDLCDRLSWFAGSRQWPAGVKRPSFLLTLEGSLNQARHKLLAASKALMEVEKALQSHLKKLKTLIEQGLLKEGQALLRECHLLQRELPIRSGERYQKELRHLTQALNELRDWQGFATIPKKQELLATMKALAESTSLEPKERASRVKSLQQTWRELGADGSQEDKSLWEAFKQAGEEAYAPCRPYFDAQQKLRDENLAHRQQILEHLEAYLNENDWGNADWTLVVKTLKVAREQWRASSPVERRHHGRTQKKFEAVVSKIQVLIDAERDRNLQLKAKIVEEAAALVDYDELDTAIEAMKALQVRWKAIGMAKKESDQDLWKQFRQHADVLFAQRHQHRAELDEQRERNLNEAHALTQELERLLQQDSSALFAHQEAVKQWQQRFEQIAPLPKDKAASARSAFRRLVVRYGELLEEARSRQSIDACRRLSHAANLLDQFDRSLSLEGAAGVSVQRLKDEWQELGALPEEAEAGMNARFDQAVSAYDHAHEGALERSEAQLAQNRSALHESVLLLEIALGLDSPSEDQSMRMNLQVGRLSDKLAGKLSQQDLERSVLDALMHWAQMEKVGMFPSIDALVARFQHATRIWHDRALSFTQPSGKQRTPARAIA